jgi:hypothetical protein
MNLFYPTGLLLQFIPLVFFYNFNRQTKFKKEYRRAKLHNARQDFLEATIASKVLIKINT